MNRHWINQKQIPLLKSNWEINKKYKWAKDNRNKRPAVLVFISQRWQFHSATQTEQKYNNQTKDETSSKL